MFAVFMASGYMAAALRNQLKALMGSIIIPSERITCLNNGC